MIITGRWPNQQHQNTKGSQFAAVISFNATRTTPLCYSMNCRQPPLGYSQRKGPSVTKTQSAGPISCLERCATRALHSSLVTRAAVLIFPLYSSPSLIKWGCGGWGVPGLVDFTTSGQDTKWVYSNPGTHTGNTKNKYDVVSSMLQLHDGLSN